MFSRRIADSVILSIVALYRVGQVNARRFASQVVSDWVGEYILTLQPSFDQCYLKVEGKRSGPKCRLHIGVNGN